MYVLFLLTSNFCASAPHIVFISDVWQQKKTHTISSCKIIIAKNALTISKKHDAQHK